MSYLLLTYDVISLFISLCANINPHYNRAYESGTTQTARRLDCGGYVRQRRPNTDRRQNLRPSGSPEEGQKNAEQLQAGLSSHKTKSTHTLFFGTDDITSLKEKTDGNTNVPEKQVTEEPTFADAKQAKEWREIHDLARSVFHVYFTSNDCDADDIAQMKKSHSSIKPSLLKKINGTMPWLNTRLKGLSAPQIVKAPILFIDASFRGIAQVRMEL